MTFDTDVKKCKQTPGVANEAVGRTVPCIYDIATEQLAYDATGIILIIMCSSLIGKVDLDCSTVICVEARLREMLRTHRHNKVSSYDAV